VKQAAVWAAAVGAMIAFGVGTYATAGSLSGAHIRVERPSTSLVSLPGTLYVAQAGAIYRLRGGSFKQITPNDGWTQPAVSPDGKRLVAVKQALNWSDLYLLGPDGQVEAQLTHNSSRRPELDHWAFYPHFSPDGSTVFYSYDPKDPYNSYRVDLAIFSRSPDPANSLSTGWTEPNLYTGGDANPVPLKEGLIFTRFSIDEHSQVHSQIWLQAQPGSPGVALTAVGDDCAQPTVSPDAKLLAMVCRHGQLRGTELAVAPLDVSNGSIGPAKTVVTGGLLASPSFSWNGATLAYLAPEPAGGSFQLWTVAVSGPATVARQVTRNLGLDASAAPVWVAGDRQAQP
jgi:Tol biopolymer transport system component